MRVMRYMSFCSGIEAATQAWKHLGWESVLLSEIEEFPREILLQRCGAEDLRKTYAHIGPALWGDFTALRVRHLRRFNIPLPDLLVAGTPCQAFSIAGLRKSLDDDRGNLTLQFVRVANAIDNVRRREGRAPLTICWENVPGVLSVGDNAFGCFLAALVGADAPLVPPSGLRWTNAGLVTGPKRSAAWRVLNAQFFGLAQRRERVFVVASAGDPAYTAQILFEPRSVHGHYPPSREAGESVAPTIAARIKGGGGLGMDFETGGGYSLSPALTNSGRGTSRTGESRGQDCVIPVPSTGDTAHCLNAGAMGRIDYETETLVTHALRAEGFDSSEDGTGRGTPIIAQTITADMYRSGGATAGNNGGVRNLIAAPLTGNAYADRASEEPNLIPVAIQERAICENPDAGPDGAGFKQDGLAYTLEARAMPQAVAFDTTQITSAANRSNPKPGAPCHPLAAGAHVPAVAFSCKDYGADAGEIAPTMRSMGHDKSHANAGGQLAVACFKGGQGAKAGGLGYSEDVAPTLSSAPSGTQLAPALMQGMAVRRLTVVECARLQGFPDTYLHIERNTRRKIEADEAEYLQSHGLRCECVDGQWYTRVAADGPMYRALGNSMAVPVMRHIGERIAAVEAL